MTIIDLEKKHHELYFKCLEDWSDEMKESGNHKTCWYEKYKDKGLRVKLSLNENGEVGGMIQYLPIEHSIAKGKDLYFILCIWVHGYKEGRGSFQKKGMGRALIQAAEKDVKSLGGKGMVAWGLWIPVWMKASWFKKQGYKKADRDSIRVLMWKPFTDDVQPPKWVKQNKKPKGEAGKVVVTSYINGWCPAQNIAHERAKRACADFGNYVEYKTIDTSDRQTFLEWGISDALYVNTKNINTGPPPSYEKIKKIIGRQLKNI